MQVAELNTRRRVAHARLDDSPLQNNSLEWTGDAGRLAGKGIR